MGDTNVSNVSLPRDERGSSFLDFFSNMPFMPGKFDFGLFVSMLTTILFMVGVGVYMIFDKIHPVIYKAFMILLGFCIGFIVVSVDPTLSSKTLTVCPPGLLYSILPVLLFCHTLSIDYHTLCRNLKHILIISISTFVGHMFIVALVSYPVLRLSFSWPSALIVMFTAMTSAVMSEYTVDELSRVQGQVRQLQLLVQGDKLISTTLALFVLATASKYMNINLEYQNVPISYTVQYAALQVILGIGIGLLCGVSIRYPFKYAYKDITVQLMLILSAIYISYFASEVFGGSGPFAVTFFGIMLSSTKIKMSGAAENFFRHFWPLVLFVVDTLIFFEVGFLHGIVPENMTVTDAALFIILYLLIVINRAIVYLILSPFITKSGPQLSFQHVFVAIWGVYRGSPTIIFAMIFFINFQHVKSRMALQVLTYSTLIVLMSMFFNVVLLKNVLRILGMYELSRTRLVNMNRAMAQVHNCREKGIFSLKMDRVIADANWQVVEHITKLSHPYRKRIEVADMDDDFGDETQKRVISCGGCGTEVMAPPTKKELADITLEAKHRILKAQLVSFWRQYDNGTLSRHGIRILANLVESAIVREDPVLYSSDLKIQREGTAALRCLKKFFGSLLTVTSKTHRFIPTNWFRAICFRICTSRSFQITMACLALLDLILLLHLLMTFFFRDFTMQDNMSYGLVYQYFDLVFYSIFTTEFWLQVSGIGMIQYFISHISKIEFAASIIVRTSEVFMYSDTCLQLGHMISVYETDYIIMYMKVLLVFRVTRIYIFIVALIPKLLNMVDRQMDDDLMRSYDIGKAYLISLDRVIKFLTHIVSNETVYNNLKNMMEQDRQKVTQELGLIQKDRPTIAITIKTKHAIRNVINTMNGCITEMKEEGILDSIENKALLESIDRIKKKLRDLSLVHPCSPDFILRELPWLNGDPDSTNFLLEHARLSSYDAEEVIIHYGDNPNGLYILVTGMVKTFYKPSKFTTIQSNKLGVLPNYDFFINLRFELPQEEYVVGGNVIGEMGIVTARPYDMQVVCETAVHLYYIPWNVVKAVVHDSGSSPVIQARIWKVISIRICLNLLHHTPHFQGWPRERLLLYLQYGLVPILTGVHSVHINEFVDDVLLVEGVAMDHATRTIFYAPFYVPRTIQKILLPTHPLWNFKTEFQTRIMIIPSPHCDQEDIMGPDGIFKDQYGASLAAQNEPCLEEDNVLGDVVEGCEHGSVKAIRAMANRLLQVQKRRQRQIGFMDYTPHIAGPIEGIPAKTTYIIKKDKKNKDIEVAGHPRTMLDSIINYVQDIKEESETGSMRGDEDDEEEEAKRKKRTSRHRSSTKRLGRYKMSESFDRISSNFGMPGDQDLSEKKLEIHVIESSSEEVLDVLTKEAQTTLQMDDAFLTEWREKSPERQFRSFGSLSIGKLSTRSISLNR